jgi:hypothetical protein
MKTNANRRIRLEATFQIMWRFSTKFRLARSRIVKKLVPVAALSQKPLLGGDRDEFFDHSVLQKHTEKEFTMN